MMWRRDLESDSKMRAFDYNWLKRGTPIRGALLGKIPKFLGTYTTPKLAYGDKKAYGIKGTVGLIPLLTSSGDGQGGSSFATGQSDDELSTNYGGLDLEALSRLDGRRWSSSCRSQEGLELVAVNRDGEEESMTESIRTLSQKYRPMFFEELIGQNIVVQSLMNAIVRGRVASLYLFQGPRGTGKTSTARVLAAALNCLASNKTKLCGVCRECSEFILGNVLRQLPSKAQGNLLQKAMQTQALELVLLEDDLAIGELIRFPSRAGNRGVCNSAYPIVSGSNLEMEHRQEKIFNLVYEIGATKDLIAARKDENNTNVLHLAAKLAPPNRLNIDSGAALQLRRELLWFKEVEKIVQPLYKQMKDSNGRTPGMLFTEEHKGLVCEGEKWMKDTASSCMVVATLIATVMFAAAFTVPGSDNDDTGSPIFPSHLSFLVFAISDALALFSSATSILMFQSIVTSRYAEEDFLDSLPNRLILGLATLFISIATMMVSFCATIFIVLGRGFARVALPLVLLAGIRVTLFALLQFPLFVDMLSHTYRFSSLFRPTRRLLF
ncbi:hypothetical protein RJ639_014046 [Escallonia herrerae]|uniref:PGG domain-containing protein n=1 Tax=Escallonia herrerae TaxID=1293975 RepID=A0AA88VFI7_9ASTE|nr:hypothetical protein RJ639_014046 [Escallonia herrerae]